MRHTLLFCLLLTASGLRAQTIIELERGGTVRSKTIDDYRDEMQMTERLRSDSILYYDHLRRGFSALHTDSLGLAEAHFGAALKIFPAAPGVHVVHYNLALIDYARGDRRRATARLDKVLAQVPDYTDARLMRAKINLEAGNAREAAEDAQTLLENDVSCEAEPALTQEALFIRAAARYRLRLYVEARADVHRLLKADPGNANAQVLEALIMQQTGQRREALNALNRIVAAWPEHTEALLARAELETELEMHMPARADYDTLIRLHPDDGDLYVERARTLLQLGEKQAARRDLDEALRLGVPRGMVQALYNLTR